MRGNFVVYTHSFPPCGCHTQHYCSVQPKTQELLDRSRLPGSCHSVALTCLQKATICCSTPITAAALGVDSTALACNPLFCLHLPLHHTRRRCNHFRLLKLSSLRYPPQNSLSCSDHEIRFPLAGLHCADFGQLSQAITHITSILDQHHRSSPRQAINLPLSFGPKGFLVRFCLRVFLLTGPVSLWFPPKQRPACGFLPHRPCHHHPTTRGLAQTECLTHISICLNPSCNPSRTPSRSPPQSP